MCLSLRSQRITADIYTISFLRIRLLFVCLCIVGLNACGTLRDHTGAEPASTPSVRPEQNNARDPFEGFNRAMYTFNDKLDTYALKPLAKGYRAITPAPVSKGISNFFSNLHDPMAMLNNFLQGKPGKAASDLGRFLINSTLGMLGLFDVSTEIGLQKHDEDFGQTLAVWGVGDGPYLVLPFFGPSNVRDGFSLPVDWETYPPNHMENSRRRYQLLFLEIIDKRAQLLAASDVLAQAAGEDAYVFVREASRQRRRNQIFDGNPPQAPPPPGLFEDDEPPGKPDAPAPKAPSP